MKRAVRRHTLAFSAIKIDPPGRIVGAEPWWQIRQRDGTNTLTRLLCIIPPLNVMYRSLNSRSDVACPMCCRASPAGLVLCLGPNRPPTTRSTTAMIATKMMIATPSRLNFRYLFMLILNRKKTKERPPDCTQWPFSIYWLLLFELGVNEFTLLQIAVDVESSPAVLFSQPRRSHPGPTPRMAPRKVALRGATATCAGTCRAPRRPRSLRFRHTPDT